MTILLRGDGIEAELLESAEVSGFRCHRGCQRADRVDFWHTLPMPRQRQQERPAQPGGSSAAAAGQSESPAQARQDPSQRRLRPSAENEQAVERTKEIGGPQGPEPTRYGDWERAGRCIDF